MNSNENENDMGGLLAVAAVRAVPVVAGIGDDALAASTPCADYDVKALVNHLFKVIVEFQKLAAKGASDFAETPDVVGTDPRWRDRFAEEADALVAAWSAPGALEGTSGSMEMPARTVAGMVLLDLTVHAWDLARATGQVYEAEPRVVEELAGTVAGLAPMARKTGVFGPSVPVGEDAPPFARLLAATGRDPEGGSA